MNTEGTMRSEAESFTTDCTDFHGFGVRISVPIAGVAQASVPAGSGFAGTAAGATRCPRSPVPRLFL